jgi:putative molybdopterin biosynthesis protein
MSTELMNTKEVADYLDIHEKQVYSLIKAGRIPCTRVTGKWIFPRKMIDEWIESNTKVGLKHARDKAKRIPGALLAAGSNDPVLDMLFTATKKTPNNFLLFSANTGSINGLTALNSGYTDIAFSHLLHPESGEYNSPFFAEYLSAINPVAVNLFYRQLGFLVRSDQAALVRGYESLTKNKLRFVNRQKNSGTRQLLDYNLKKLVISPQDIIGYENELYTHLEIGLAVLTDDADVGMGSAAIAKMLNLAFVPITNERFDMILDQSVFFQPEVQFFIETMKSDMFRKQVEKLGGYDFKDSGKIVYSVQ